MRISLKIMLFFFLTSSAYATKNTNALESELLRFSSIQDTQDYILPFFRDEPKSVKDLGNNLTFNFFFFGNSDIVNLANNLTSGDSEAIVKEIDESFGVPKTALIRVGVNYNYKKFTQSFNVNAGEVLVINNPVSPEISGLVFFDIAATSSYKWTSHSEYFSLEGSLSFIKRKAIKNTISLARLVDNDYEDFNLEQADSYNLVEGSLSASFNLDYIDLQAQIRSIPLGGQRFSYWDSIIDIRSKDLALTSKYFSFWDIYAQYSPVYGGDYDILTTYKLGTGIGLSDHLAVDIFASGKLHANLIITLRLETVEFSVYSVNKVYDQEFYQEARAVGIDTRYRF